MTEDAQLFDALRQITTATLTTVLLKRGLRKVWMTGAKPLTPDLPRAVGRAFTMRFIPGREDVATPASWSSPRSTRAAIEDMPPGCIAVIDAMGVKEAGVYGDILCARMAKRGVAALVTDGVMRDARSVVATGLPSGATARRLRPRSHRCISWAGRTRSAAVESLSFRTTSIVADSDGAVVIPAAMAAEVTETAVEQERLESWIMSEVEKGVPLPGLYPPNEETKARVRAGPGPWWMSGSGTTVTFWSGPSVRRREPQTKSPRNRTALTRLQTPPLDRR